MHWQDKMRTRNLFFLLVILILLFFLYSYVDPNESFWVPKCPLKLLTGWNCPSCGTQRAFHALIHGHLFLAIQYNWFALVSVPYAGLLLFTAFLMNPGCHRDRFRHFFESRNLVLLYVYLYFLWFVVRNIFNI